MAGLTMVSLSMVGGVAGIGALALLYDS